VFVPDPGSVVEFSVELAACVDVDSNDGRFDDLLDELIADPRALGGDCIGHGLGEVGTVFQVEVLGGDDAIASAATVAVEIFDAALRRAGLDAQTSRISIVEGGDPDKLPWPAPSEAASSKA
jgi:hypothetical protein